MGPRERIFVEDNDNIRRVGRRKRGTGEIDSREESGRQ